MVTVVKQSGWAGLWAVAIWFAGAALGVQPPEPSGAWTYLTPTGFRGLAQEALFDLAIAIALAIVVFQLVERAHRKRIDQERLQAANHSFVSMFRKAFGSFFSDDMIQESIDALFSKVLLRKRFEIEYNFERHPQSSQILRLHIIVEYEIENISEISQPYDIKLMMPNIMASYRNDPLREPPTLLSASIDNRVLSDMDIEKANASINIDDHNSVLLLDRVTVAPRKTLKVHTETRVLKSACGAETMRFYLPTKNVKVKVINKDKDIEIDIKGIGSKDFPDKKFAVKDQSRWSWDTSHLFLPENGWVLYWNDVSQNLSGLPVKPSAVSPQPGGERIDSPTANER